jgi:hypothetical protein
MVFACSSCGYTTKQSGNLKRHINRKNSTCLPLPPEEPVAPEIPKTPPRRGGRRKKETPVAEAAPVTPTNTNSTVNVFVNGSDITTLPDSYWDFPSGKLVTREVLSDYDDLLSTLCDGIIDEEGSQNLGEIRNFLENWRKQKDDHNKQVVLECLHDFHSLSMIMQKEIIKKKQQNNTS